MSVILGDEAACAYLLETHSLTRKPRTMRKLRVIGGGPRFRVFAGRFAGYPKEELDAWVVERLGGIAGSTSEIHSIHRKAEGSSPRDDDDTGLMPAA